MSANAAARGVGWRGTAALAGRETRRVLVLWTQTIAPAVVTALLFLAVFGGALGDRLRHIDGTPYARYILPGLLVMAVAGQAFANTATSLFQAKSEGYIDDLLTSPLRAWQLVAGYLAGALVRSLLAAVVILLAAWPLTDADRVAHPLLLGLTLALTALVFAALGVVTGMWADTFDRHAFVANLVITPLALIGGVFYDPAQLHQPWSTLTRIDPLFYLVAAARTGTIGLHEVRLGFVLPGIVLAATTSLIAAAALLDRGWRLKP